MTTPIKIAVVSDIHCHKKDRSPGSTINSFLLTNTPATPINQNPISSLKDLISRKKIQADVLIAPGDFCDQMDEDGFKSSWLQLKEIALLLGDCIILPTIGNHDVNSHEVGKTDVFRFAKNMDIDFPFSSDDENNKFWALGYVIKKFDSLDLAVLVINSSYHHYSLPEAKKGRFDDTQLEKLRKDLMEINNYKFKMAVSHHHPIAHEERGGGSDDVMVNGSILIQALVDNGFHFYIHGHKHDTRLKYSNHGVNSLLVFASGSLSRFPYPSLSGVENTFHLINIENDIQTNCKNQGYIETYFFAQGLGFEERNTRTFPHKTGFGCRSTPEELAKKTLSWVESQATNGKFIAEWISLIEQIPEISYLIPDDLTMYSQQCKLLNIQFNDKLPQNPELISFKK